jgi:transcription antitermination factor NusG
MHAALATGDEVTMRTRFVMAYTEARREGLAAWHLGQMGYATFYPKQRLTVTVRGKKRELVQALWPRYVAVDATDKPIADIEAAMGVSTILHSANGPRWVDSETVTGWVPPEPEPLPCFSPGDRVLVVGGAFDGWRGVIDEFLDRGRKACISLRQDEGGSSVGPLGWSAQIPIASIRPDSGRPARRWRRKVA